MIHLGPVCCAVDVLTQRPQIRESAMTEVALVGIGVAIVRGGRDRNRARRVVFKELLSDDVVWVATADFL